FVNAGGTNQKGVEMQLNADLYNGASQNFVRRVNWNSATTLSDFSFRNYIIGNNNYSGNRLTGIPRYNTVNSIEFSFKPNFTLFIQHLYNGRTSLNDAETVFADAYHLIQMKLNWEKNLGKRLLTVYM